MFKELASKNTIRQVASAWYGFTSPLSEGLTTATKPESLYDRVKRIDAKYRKHDRKEG
jgi:hypothetical protein